MDEKIKNEVPDEELESVAGGAYFRYNPETGKYDLFFQDGTYVRSESTEANARIMMMALRQAEKSGSPN